MLSMLRRLVRRDVTISPLVVRPGDDLILAIDLVADQDLVGLLSAAQQQFPCVRVHLLAGFGSVQIQRNERSSDGKQASDDGKHQGAGASLFRQASQPSPTASEQGNIVVLRYAAGGRVIAVSIPPEQQGNFLKQS